MAKMIKKAMLIFAVFLSGCSWDFGAVEAGYRGVFNYKPQIKLPQTITAVVEGDLVTISSSNNSIGGTLGTFQLGTFHVSSAVGRYSVDGIPIYVLYNGTERVGYFNSGEKDVFYPGPNDDNRQDYFIRRGSDVVVEPVEPEYPDGLY
jgi:hypothetical protein